MLLRKYSVAVLLMIVFHCCCYCLLLLATASTAAAYYPFGSVEVPISLLIGCLSALLLWAKQNPKAAPSALGTPRCTQTCAVIRYSANRDACFGAKPGSAYALLNGTWYSVLFCSS